MRCESGVNGGADAATMAAGTWPVRERARLLRAMETEKRFDILWSLDWDFSTNSDIV